MLLLLLLHVLLHVQLGLLLRAPLCQRPCRLEHLLLLGHVLGDVRRDVGLASLPDLGPVLGAVREVEGLARHPDLGRSRRLLRRPCRATGAAAARCGRRACTGAPARRRPRLLEVADDLGAEGLCDVAQVGHSRVNISHLPAELVADHRLLGELLCSYRQSLHVLPQLGAGQTQQRTMQTHQKEGSVRVGHGDGGEGARGRRGGDQRPLLAMP
mmetsp:Transcript_59258/g.190655  ORF Transcript_59258/g.190655 Transcript_59258/m.190655 type:complete len:213 (+) Transcript_59258:2117-2755(+)